eukprot:TRINITY_DN61497_c0_g1_i1.p1 TRINITY_DN61497_c0_g1~~TRINITY_DN61497_c0_g1_i1.p1  ORF type:complete len:372 (+),score=45.72 TRINITY_DN61497_c0_g1_i1:98-1117(+)
MADVRSPLLSGDFEHEFDDDMAPVCEEPECVRVGGGWSAEGRHVHPVRWAASLRRFISPCSLAQAASAGDAQQVHALLAGRADPNADSGRGMAAALHKQHWEVLALLIAYGGTTTEAFPAIVLSCIRTRDDSGLQLVLHARVDVNGRDRIGATPLLWSVARGTLRTVQSLLAHRADVNSKDGFGIGAVAAAAFRGNVQILHEVLRAGSGVNAYDRLRQTPLFFACLEGHLDVVHALLAASADVAHRSLWGGDALFCATERNHRPVITALVEASCIVNGQSPEGSTALHVACGRGHAGAARLLLELRASPGLRSACGDRPLDKARGHPAVIEVLQRGIVG